jgi:hypothetical protein
MKLHDSCSYGYGGDYSCDGCSGDCCSDGAYRGFCSTAMNSVRSYRLQSLLLGLVVDEVAIQ